jgi:succinate dehydrogenase / fumarate reductase iron-sulfur subunit
MNLTLSIWRQQSANAPGAFVRYRIGGVTADMSFLEMLDMLNEDLINRNEVPVAFEHDCREGICGSCGFLVNGVAHGGQRGTTVCQLAMRFFKDCDTLTLEPWRARASPSFAIWSLTGRLLIGSFRPEASLPHRQEALPMRT